MPKSVRLRLLAVTVSVIASSPYLLQVPTALGVDPTGPAGSAKPTTTQPPIQTQPVRALAGQSIVLGTTGNILATVIGADAGFGSDFGISSPTSSLLISNATFNVGTTAPVGTFNAGQELVFYLSTPAFGTTYLSTSDHAQVAQLNPWQWQINWEDSTDFDFNDLIVVISYDTAPGLADTLAQARENAATSKDPVQTFSGGLTYQHTDLSISGRGPSPTVVRSYYSADTRVGPMGPGWTFNYDAHVASISGSNDTFFVGPDGNTDRFTANPDGTYAPAAATYRTLVRNTDRTYTLTERDGTKWMFLSVGKLASIADRYGNTTSLTYDGLGQLSTVSDPAGRGSLTFGYTSGKLTSVTDWLSPARTVTYQYDASGRLWKVTDREGKTTTLTYDGTAGRLATITDARAHVALTLTYDAQGRVATQKDARGIVTGDATTFAYVINGDGTRVTTVTEPVTSFEPTFHPTLTDSYDANGWLTQRVSHPSSTETLTEAYTYDAIGNRTSVTDPRGNRTDFCYDVNYAGTSVSGSRGNLTRTVSPPPTTGANRPVSLVAYDTKNNVSQTVSPKGVPSGTSVTCSTNLSAINTAFATDFAYDASLVKLTSVTSRFTDPDTGLQTSTTKYEYGDAANPGRVTRAIPPRGNTTGSPDYTFATTFAYAASGTKAGFLTSLADALGNTTTYDYDAVGRVTAIVDPNGNAGGGMPADHTTNVVYDKEDRTRFAKLPAPTAGGAQLVTETRYDEVGNPVVRIDANGQVTTYAYDERDKQPSDASRPQWSRRAGGILCLRSGRMLSTVAGQAHRIEG